MSDKVYTEDEAHTLVLASSAAKGMPEMLPWAIVKVDQNGLRSKLISLDAGLHANAIQCYLHAFKHGDTTPMKRLLVDIVEDKKTGYRRQGMIAHMRRFTPMILVKDVIKLAGTVNGVPIPWDIETANLTPFYTIPEFDEMIAWKPVFKGGIVGKLETALKAYKNAVGNTKIEDGRVVGPIDPKKPYYNGIHLDKMDNTFDKIELALNEFGTFADDTAEVAEARKLVETGQRYLEAKEKQVEAQAETVAPEGEKTPAPITEPDKDKDKDKVPEGAEA